MEKKMIPELSMDKASCCGCASCYAVCPVDAITMVADEKGFLYPQINSEKCIRCQRCMEVCAFKKDKNIV